MVSGDGLDDESNKPDERGDGDDGAQGLDEELSVDD